MACAAVQLLVASAAVLVIATPDAHAGALSPCSVRVTGTTYADLQTAIDAAPTDSTLVISGVCWGAAQSQLKDLTLRGDPGAMLVSDPEAAASGDIVVLTLSHSASFKIRRLDIQGEVVATDAGLMLDRSSVRAVDVRSGTGRIIDSTVSSGSAVGGPNAAGAGVENDGTLKIVRSTLSYDWDFGAINTGTMKIVDSTIAGSHQDAAHASAGIKNTGTLRILSSTVARNGDNQGGTGGLVNVGGSVTITATVLALNWNGDCKGVIRSGGYNIVGTKSGCGFAAAPTDRVGVVPSLVPRLGNFGGPTDTLPPLATSSALDAIPVGATGPGTVPLCPAVGGTDQRGMPRLVGPKCDVGSVEGAADSETAIPIDVHVVGEPDSDAIFNSPVVFPRGSDYLSPSSVFPVGTVVPMEAVADPGYAFIGWSGACTGRAGCRVTMTQARSVTATFAPIAYRPDALIGTSRNGAFLGGGIYNLSTLHQTLRAHVERFQAVSFIVRLADRGDVPDVFRVQGTRASPGFRIRYFAGSHQVTREVLAGRYEVGVLLDGFTGIQVRVVATGAARLGASLHFSVRVSSEGDPLKSDAVRGIVTVQKK